MQLNFFNSNLFYIFDLSKGKETTQTIKGRDTQSAEKSRQKFLNSLTGRSTTDKKKSNFKKSEKWKIRRPQRKCIKF